MHFVGLYCINILYYYCFTDITKEINNIYFYSMLIEKNLETRCRCFEEADSAGGSCVREGDGRWV